MTYTNTRLIPLGKDYVFPVRWSIVGPTHGVWGRRGRVTCCGLDYEDLMDSLLPNVAGRLTCDECLTKLRGQGWDV